MYYDNSIYDGMYNNLYHIHRPNQVKEIGKRYSVAPDIYDANNIKSLLLHGFKVPPTEDFLESRKIILTNSDCHIALAAPKKSMTEYFYKNSASDEVLFIHKGS